MVERPILFSAPMVRAILAGHKTQTRRVVKPQFPADAIVAEVAATTPEGWQVSGHSGLWWDDAGACLDDAVRCPYGMPGDRMWVRETWQWNGGLLDCGHPIGQPTVYKQLYTTYPADGEKRTIEPRGFVKVPQQPPIRDGEVYSLRDAPDDFEYDGQNTYCDRLTRWWNREIPSIHMPRWASRILLEVTDVRVERLRDISAADAIAEGIERVGECNWKDYLDSGHNDFASAKRSYGSLWELINGQGSWALNPWVWVIKFKVIKP